MARKYHSSQTKVVVVSWIVNWGLLLAAAVILGQRTETGGNNELGSLLPLGFYIVLTICLVTSTVSAKLIRYTDYRARWGAWIFISIVPPVTLILIALLR